MGNPGNPSAAPFIQSARTGTSTAKLAGAVAKEVNALPPLVTFPEAAWRNHLVPEEWQACLDAWISLAEAHLSLSAADFVRISSKDESLSTFLKSFGMGMTSSNDLLSTPRTKELRKDCYFLSYRLLDLEVPPEPLLRWGFLSDVSKAYGKNQGNKLVSLAWKKHASYLEISMGSVKNSLIKLLDAGLKGDLKIAEQQLRRLNHLLNASPESSSFFMAGSDFLDSLISCYKLMNPPLRKAIICTVYLSLIGLTEGEKPKFSSLVDQLYYLKAAAEAHKVGPTNVNDSLVAELVTVTPILKQVQQRIDASGSELSRAKDVIAALGGFRKAGGSGRPVNLIKMKIDKGKQKAIDDGFGHGLEGQVHIHQMSLISQVQDLFPDLGSGFVVKLLDAYHEDVEQLISHLLEESLPPHLASADRSEQLQPTNQESISSFPEMAPHSTPPHLPTRRNVYDDDEFDQLAISTSKLHFGRNSNRTADDVLQDKSTAASKAAILSALAAFDSDDDERDDTYDTADVGGTVDAQNPDDTTDLKDNSNKYDEVLFMAYKSLPTMFDRDAATRRGEERANLRNDTGMTNEEIEGWALMLSRDQRQLRRLEAQFSTFGGMQQGLASTGWRASPAGFGTEEEGTDGGGMGRGNREWGANDRGRGGRLRGQGRGGGRGRGRGNVAGQTGDKETEEARRRKDANKGSRANHNRRDQRAKKMARAGFPG